MRQDLYIRAVNIEDKQGTRLMTNSFRNFRNQNDNLEKFLSWNPKVLKSQQVTKKIVNERLSRKCSIVVLVATGHNGLIQFW